MNKLLNIPDKLLVKFITLETGEYSPFAVHSLELRADTLKHCDVLLVEGIQWVSTAIKYLSQSTWSHAAIFVGNIIDPEEHAVDLKVLIVADVKDGVIGVPLSCYTHLNTRILRPVGLTAEDKCRIIGHMMRHLGSSYCLRNVWDSCPLPVPYTACTRAGSQKDDRSWQRRPQPGYMFLFNCAGLSESSLSDFAEDIRNRAGRDGIQYSPSQPVYAPGF